MITSALALQHFFIHEKIAEVVAAQLKKQNLVMPKPLMLFGYDQPTEIVDPEVTAVNKAGQTIHVSDTSALKALENGCSARELFKKALHIHPFSLEELLEARGKSLDGIEKLLS